MLYLTQNIETKIVTNVQELATSNNYLLHLTHSQDEDNPIKFYPVIDVENKRYVSFLINLPDTLGEYKYTFFDGDGINLDGAFIELETGILKITE